MNPPSPHQLCIHLRVIIGCNHETGGAEDLEVELLGIQQALARVVICHAQMWIVLRDIHNDIPQFSIVVNIHGDELCKVSPPLLLARGVGCPGP